jgi:hypothetical protein
MTNRVVCDPGQHADRLGVPFAQGGSDPPLCLTGRARPLTGAMPANAGFELAFLMSAAVALLAGVCGLLIPQVRRGEHAGARVLAVR